MDVLYPRCAGLDVHKDSVVAAVRVAAGGPAMTEVRSFDTTTPGLLALSGWLGEAGCTHVAMEATGVYWKPVWHVLSDGDVTLICQIASNNGSDSSLVQGGGHLSRRDEPGSQQIDVGASEHLALDELEPGDLAFGLPVGPGLGDGSRNGGAVGLDAVREGGHLGSSSIGEPRVEIV